MKQRLEELRGNAPLRAPTVRVLAAFSGHTDCNLASLGFAAGVDYDKLLAGTEYVAPFGQSPFAFSRGLAFERLIAANGYGATLELLRTGMGFPVEDARVVNLRDGYPKNRQGMALRAHETKTLVNQIVQGDPAAPNLIDGAVLATEIGGVKANFEADALAARFGGQIHVGEVKSFPLVDGRADGDKVGGALDQAAVYILLGKRLISELGGDDELVSSEAMLITPKNVGLTPVVSVKDVSSRVARAERLLARVPGINDLSDSIPGNASFAPIADPGIESMQRVETLHDLADHVGTYYVPSCLASCGLARFCRERAFADGAAQLAGSQTVRLLPGVQSLDRASELAEGAPATDGERPVAAQLARAARLYDDRFRAVGQGPRP